MTNSRNTPELRARGLIRLSPILMLLLFCTFGFSDCGPKGCTYTLYPIYSEKELYLDDSIVGTWTSSDLVIKIEKSKADPKAYDVEWTDEKKNQTRTELRLARIGKHTFVDFATPKNLEGAKSLFPSTRLHAFFELKRYKGVALLGMMPAALTGTELHLAAKFETKIDFASPAGDDVVITSPTHDLQQFALEIANKEPVSRGWGLEFCKDGADCELELAQFYVALDPADSKAAYRLAMVYAVRGDLDDAAAAWRRAPSHQALFSDGEAQNLARTFIEKRRMDEAVAVVSSSTKGKERDYDCWVGWLYLEADMPAEAAKAYRKCSGLGAALAFEELGDFASARAEVEKGRPYYTFNSTSAQLLVSWASFAEGNYQGAYDQYPDDPKLNELGGNVTGAYWRYLALMHQGKREQAARLLNDPAFRVFGHIINVEPRWTIWQSDLEIEGAEAYLRGQIDETEMLASVKPDSESRLPGKMCMAYFIIAENHLLDGDRAAAQKFFRKAVYTHAMRTAAWIISDARLKQLQKSER